MMVISGIFFILILVLLFLIWVATCINEVSQQHLAFLTINDNEWHIDKLPKTIYFVQFLNAIGLGCGSSCFVSTMLYIVDRMVVQPALKESLKVMEDAEEKGTIDPILCNQKARDDMTQRVQEYYNTIYKSQTMNAISKIFNYSGAFQCLLHHKHLLELGMSEDVSNEKVKEPVFIVSFPRTGTTILHRTMSLDRTRFRNFDLCDMIAPLPDPVPRWDMKGREAKAVEGNNLLDQIKAVFPGFAECLETMHGFRADEADEDLGWYNTGLGHLYFDPLIKLYPENRAEPEGMSKLESSKEVTEYRYAWLAMIMRLYQHTDKTEWEKKKVEAATKESTLSGPDEETPLSSDQQQMYEGPCPTNDLPWLMKDPNHSAYLPELLNQFPDAKFIFTHRAPGEIVPSMAKLFVILTSVEFQPYAPGTSSKEWGVEANLRMKHYCDGLVDFTKSQDPLSPLSLHKVGKTLDVSTSTRRIDMYFKNLVQDVPGAICNIYKQLYPDQPAPSEEAMEAFKIYLKGNERGKHGNQRRSLKDFHLTEDDVAFKEYHELFLD
jgi:hypothetical protein